MKNLILHPTDVSQWYALVTEAELATNQNLNEDTESYLVFLLQRFAQSSQLFESAVAMDWLTAVQGPSQLQSEQLKTVGDKSLLVCGLFPGLAKRRNVSIDYYRQMGQTAYLTLSELHASASAELYLHLSQHFPNLQKILQAMRGDFYQFSQAQPNLVWIGSDDSQAH